MYVMYYASMLWCWQLVRVLVRTNHPCLRVGRHNQTSDFSEGIQGTLWLGKRICIRNLKPIKELILREAHDSTYSIHPCSTNMYKDLKTQYWWYGMK
jgi:hypothetical protein